MRTGTILRLALVAVLATVTTGLECAEGPLDRANGPNVSTRSMTGTWEGPIVTLVMRAVLTDNDGTITGTGTMLRNGASFAVTLSGTRTGSNFTLNVTEVEREPFTFSGTVMGSGAGTSLVGIANGGGFVNQAITLTRQ